MNKKVAILLGSKNDKPFIEPSISYYEHFGIDVEVHVMSAHRNPENVAKFGENIIIKRFSRFQLGETVKPS